MAVLPFVDPPTSHLLGGISGHGTWKVRKDTILCTDTAQPVLDGILAVFNRYNNHIVLLTPIWQTGKPRLRERVTAQQRQRVRRGAQGQVAAFLTPEGQP